MIIFMIVHGFARGLFSAKIFGNGGQNELKLPGRSEKTFYVTSISHILKSVW